MEDNEDCFSNLSLDASNNESKDTETVIKTAKDSEDYVAQYSSFTKMEQLASSNGTEDVSELKVEDDETFMTSNHEKFFLLNGNHIDISYLYRINFIFHRC
ncbi:hypothetical protein ILUMI_03371 [Ignelater luminosus]|uniref:Uncharacterized protein n=1 Tax=Ignelater luminosus TaxID=2038154 RepID=A0A8K0DBP0_IGNLU|nr:hypothetical protein ILUMI_03371 [Ignelater luminosus]